MTNQELYDLILIKARRAGDTNLRAVIFAEMRGLLNGWEKSPFHPWFLETRSSGFATTADGEPVAVPTGFLLLVEDTKVRIVNADGAKKILTRMYHEDIEEHFDNVDPTLPRNYDIFADQFVFGPAADAAYAVHFKYYAATTPPPDNTSTVSNPWVLNAEDLVVHAVAERLVREYVKDYRHADELAGKATQLRTDLHKFNEARKHVDMDYSIDR